MLNSRQEKIFKLIVEDYIKSAKPIGSNSICKELDCSSATVRNEMSILEDLGLLEKTHTSSGRIPSEKGYRYYIDNIMQPKELTGEDMLKLETLFSNHSLALNDVILRSMEIVSELTNYTAVVLGNNSINNCISKIEVVPISTNDFIAIIVTDSGHVEHKNMHIDININLSEVKETVDLISKFVVGTPILEVNAKLEYEVKPQIAGSIKQRRAVYEAIYNVFNDFSEPNYKVNKPSNMLSSPEFNNVNKMRTILNKFEDKDIINNIKESEMGVNVYIGTKSEFDDDVSIIKTNYSINGEEGTIAIIGPKRMEYDKVMPLLQYIKDNIE